MNDPADFTPEQKREIAEAMGAEPFVLGMGVHPDDRLWVIHRVTAIVCLVCSGIVGFVTGFLLGLTIGLWP
jgi:hypothetical protein